MPLRFLDTDVLIDFQRRHPPAVAWFAALVDTPSVPGLAAMEMIQDAQNAAQVRLVQTLLAPMPIVWPTEQECSQALADFTRLHLSHGLGLVDALIASCARGQGATLCTFNLKHYRAVPGLATEQPYVR